MSVKLGIVSVNSTVPNTAHLVYCNKTQKTDFLPVCVLHIPLLLMVLSFVELLLFHSLPYSQRPFWAKPDCPRVPTSSTGSLLPPPIAGCICCSWCETVYVAWLAAKHLLAGLSEVWRGKNTFFLAELTEVPLP